MSRGVRGEGHKRIVGISNLTKIAGTWGIKISRINCDNYLLLYIILLPAVPGTVIRLRLNSKFSGKSEGSVKISTHNSNDPTDSLTDVKFLSKPTRISVKGQDYYYYRILVILLA